MKRRTQPTRFTYPESVKCPVCGRFGKGPLVRDSGETVIQHRERKPKPVNQSQGIVGHKRTVYCVVRERE